MGARAVVLLGFMASGKSTVGPELARRCLEENPGLRVVFVSGYTEESIASDLVSRRRAVFLPKPFSPFDLIRKVKECMAEGSEPKRVGGADPM